MQAKKAGKLRIWGAPLVAYWVVLFTMSLMSDAPTTKSDFLFPLLILAGLPIYLVAARTIVHEPGEAEAELAYTDDLTGLGNRRAFQKDARLALKHADPGELTLVMLDVNGLKQLNDECGHQAGDELIASIAVRFAQAGGPLYRVGGDEFAIMIDSKADRTLPTITQRLEPYAVRFLTCGHGHEVCVTYGTTTNQANDDLDAFFHRADDELLQNKRELYESGQAVERRQAVIAIPALTANEEPARASHLRLLG